MSGRSPATTGSLEPKSVNCISIRSGPSHKIIVSRFEMDHHPRRSERHSQLAGLLNNIIHDGHDKTIPCWPQKRNEALGLLCAVTPHKRKTRDRPTETNKRRRATSILLSTLSPRYLACRPTKNHNVLHDSPNSCTEINMASHCLFLASPSFSPIHCFMYAETKAPVGNLQT